MQQIIKNGRVENDPWRLIADEETTFKAAEGEQYILPLAMWMSFYPYFSGFDQQPALLLESDADLEESRRAIGLVPLIAIRFSNFMDGTGFSAGSLLREAFAFKGELRAVGEILPDQVAYLMRCGFDSVFFNDPNALGQCEALMQKSYRVTQSSSFSRKNYQGDVDIPQTPFQQRFSKS